MKLMQWYIDLVYGEKVTEMNEKVEVDFGFLIFIKSEINCVRVGGRKWVFIQVTHMGILLNPT